LTIGQFPALTVLQARKRALEIKSAVANGEDPAEQRKAERRELTFGALASDYLERYAKEHRTSWARDQRRIEVHFARWNNRKLTEITRTMVGQAHYGIAHLNGEVAANRAIALLRAVFNWARNEGLFDGQNPAVGLELYRERSRERFLSPEELTRVNKALMNETDWRWRAFFPLILMLGMRKGELLAARWAGVDLAQGTIKLSETKAGRSHLLPLPAAALDILKSLPSRGQSEWIFPGSGKSKHLANAKPAWARIRKDADVPDCTIHDLRRTLGSWLAASGHSLPLIGRALNHSNTAATAVYARLDLAPVRAALESNANAMRLGR
jgi:integrase